MVSKHDVDGAAARLVGEFEAMGRAALGAAAGSGSPTPARLF